MNIVNEWNKFEHLSQSFHRSFPIVMLLIQSAKQNKSSHVIQFHTSIPTSFYTHKPPKKILHPDIFPSATTSTSLTIPLRTRTLRKPNLRTIIINTAGDPRARPILVRKPAPFPMSAAFGPAESPVTAKDFVAVVAGAFDQLAVDGSKIGGAFG